MNVITAKTNPTRTRTIVKSKVVLLSSPIPAALFNAVNADGLSTHSFVEESYSSAQSGISSQFCCTSTPSLHENLQVTPPPTGIYSFGETPLKILQLCPETSVVGV